MTPDECALFGSEAAAKEALPYPEYREWRAWAIGRPYPKRRTKRRPEPAVIDGVDLELG